MQKEIQHDILKFLLQAPLDVKTLYHYLRPLTHLETRQNLLVLQHKGLVLKAAGIRRHYVYSITNRGRQYLANLERIALLEDINAEVNKLLAKEVIYCE